MFYYMIYEAFTLIGNLGGYMLIVLCCLGIDIG